MPSITNIPSAQVRKTFLDYFGHRSSNLVKHAASQAIGEHTHKIVPSIPLLPPLNDSSLTFVNAGMNAWKSHLLGNRKISGLPSTKIANVQKCVRISDFELVGYDGYHHTFFEMLGSWSFEEAYGRKDACRIAWDFLTGPMALDKEKMYVTYFSGSNEHKGDEETKEIWKSLGIKDSNILGFGCQDNYWEMGAAGPCGPCTEIHYDHKGRGASGVNQGFGDVIELWNIVFMEAERKVDGTLTPLLSQHIDTGMGLERLCAVKNGSISNFNTDLFIPIFDEICRTTGVPEYKGEFKSEVNTKKKRMNTKFSSIDTAYRIVGDHTRMVAACLSDGFLPDTNHRLKEVIRRSLQVIEKNFAPKDQKIQRQELLINLCNVNAEILGEQYPELYENLDRVKLAIEFENEILMEREMTGLKAWHQLEKTNPVLASLIDSIDASQYQDALKVLKSISLVDRKISGETAYKLYDTVGLKEDDIEILARAEQLKFERNDFRQSFASAKASSKLNSALQNSKQNPSVSLKGIRPTEDHYKYIYERKTDSHYVFPMIKAKVLDFFDTHPSTEDVVAATSDDTSSIKKKIKGDRCAIILDKTTFYSEAGGQVGDRGVLIGPNGATFVVEDCQKIEGSNLVLHIGEVKKGFFHPGTEVKVQIDIDHRIGCMQNHTATHLLNYVLHSTLPLTYQHSSRVDSDSLRFDFSAYNRKVNHEMIENIELQVNNLIGQKLNVNRSTINIQDVDTFMSSISDGLPASSPIAEEQVPVPWYHIDKEPKETSTTTQRKQNTEIQSSLPPTQNTTIEESPQIEHKFISIPGQTYPDEITLITVAGGVEPCCGTHVENIGDVQSFVVINCKSAGKGSIKSIKCVSGSEASEARQNGLKLLSEVSEVTDELEAIDELSISKKVAIVNSTTSSVQESEESCKASTPKDISKKIKQIRTSLAKETFLLPYVVRKEVGDIVNELSRHLKTSDKASFKSQMESELEEVMEDCTHLDYIVHFFSIKTSDLKLATFDKMCMDKPVLLILQENDDTISARACVPESFLHKGKGGNAQSWLQSASRTLTENSTLLDQCNTNVVIKQAKSKGSSKGQDQKICANMSRVKLASKDCQQNLEIINKIVQGAVEHASDAWSKLD